MLARGNEALGEMPGDIERARAHLHCLDPDATAFTFQTAPDRRELKGLSRILNGTLDDCWPDLMDLNQRGAGVHVTVNQTDLRGRKTENITAVRCFFAELDDVPDSGLPPFPIDPDLITASSPRNRHLLWKVDGMSFDDFHRVMAVMIERHDSDPGAKDLTRALRLPGTYHMKSETPWLVKSLKLGDTHYAL